MNRRGMALLLVLWLLVALSSLAGVTLAGARVGNQASRNRLVLTRAGWAAEGCLSIVRSRYPASIGGIDSVDLGQQVWCRVRVTDPGDFMRVAGDGGTAGRGEVGDSVIFPVVPSSRSGFQRCDDPPVVPSSRSGVQACDDLSVVPSSRRSVEAQNNWHFEGFTTFRGDGRINLNTAPEPVLRVVPGFGEEGARQLAIARNGRAPFRSPEEVVSVLPAVVRDRVMTRYAEFVAATTLSPTQLVAELEGHVGSGALVAHATITLVPTGTRLAVIRQEVE